MDIKVKLIFIEYFNEKNQNEFLLIDGDGVENIENRRFEVEYMERLGYDETNNKSYSVNKNVIDTKNTFLDGKYPSF